MSDFGPSGTAYGRLERLAFAAGFLIMLGIVAASIWLARGNEANLVDAAHTQEVRALTVDLLRMVTTAETGQRGYLLTGKDKYLAPYQLATENIPAMLARLQAEAGDGPELREWRGTIAAKLDELAETVRLARAGRREEALTLVDTDRGQTIMDRANAIAAKLTGRQRDALAADLQRSRASASALVAIDSGAFLVLALLTVFVTLSVNRYVAGLARARAALEAANAELSTGRDRLEQAVAVRTADLTQANEEIQRFAYIISHDLRAPLLNIIGFTAELESATWLLKRFVADHISANDIPVPADIRAASDEDLPEAIRFIQTSTAKMDRLINAILRLSREGRRVLVPEQLDMAALLANVIDSVRHQVDAADVDVRVAPMTPIVSDRIAVEQIFSNLVENALKYLLDDRPGRISIASTREGMMIRYDITDNGRGIAARDMERIFELFRRAGTQDRPGEGIGLAHVKALVRRLGGSIACRSTLGEGSVFSVRLPVVLMHAADGSLPDTAEGMRA
jgi:signal transduction histidine kinase